MHKVLTCISVWLVVGLLPVHADETYIFINSDDKHQQEVIQYLNQVLFEYNVPSKNKVVIDISPNAKTFSGEFIYKHDSTHKLLAKWMPRKIPEVIKVKKGHKPIYLSLDTYGSELVDSLIKQNRR